MANPFAASSGSSGAGNPFASVSGGGGGSKKRHGLLGGVTGLVGNLAGDIKDAVVGLPTGLVQTVKHPIRTAEVVAGQEWQTWSPLFHGDVGGFLQQTYDHPLAPLLDVMTVFTLGVGSAARGASVLEAAGAEGRAVKALSGLRKAKSIDIADPTGLGRHDVKVPLSTKAGRRAVQELKLQHLAPHLPKWWSNAKYERAFRKDMAHRVAATNQIEADSLQMLATIKAGGVLSDPKAWGEARHAVASGIWQGLERHAPRSIRRGAPITVEKVTGETRSLGNIKGREQYRPTSTEKVQVIDPLADPVLGQHEAFLLHPDRLKEKVAKLDKPEDFENFLRNLGREATTRDAKKAYKRADGTYPVVPKHDAATLGLEGARSSRAMRLIWEKPTRLWKIAMVGYAPRTIINNGVGNWMIYALRQGGDHAIAGLYDAIRVTKGERYARKMAAPQLYGAQSQHWAYKYHMDELGNTFAHASDLDGASAKTRLGKRLSQGLYPIVHATADKPVRLAALTGFYRSAPEVRALMKKGYKFDDAVEAAVAGNPDLRLAASERVRTVAGDYVTLNRFEQTLRNVVPFYLWDRHIVKTAGSMVSEQPGRVAALQKISNMGEEDAKKILGEMPDFLKGALPLQLLGLPGAGGNGRTNILLTQGLNPYATLAELAATGEALTTGTGHEGLGAALFGANPLITGGIEAATGRSLLTGAPVEATGGILPSVIAKTVEDLPYPKIGKALLSKSTDTSPAGNPYLYTHDVTSPLSSLLGIPLRKASTEAIQKLAEAQNSNQPRF